MAFPFSPQSYRAGDCRTRSDGTALLSRAEPRYGTAWAKGRPGLVFVEGVVEGAERVARSRLVRVEIRSTPLRSAQDDMGDDGAALSVTRGRGGVRLG